MTSTGLVLVGLLTGLWTASWGGFKDSPFEGYRPRSALRTVVLAVVLALGFALGSVVSGDSAVPAYLVVVGLCVTAERLCTEWWKTFLREDSQEAYAIPMTFAVGGRPVGSRRVRRGVGATTVVLLLLSVPATTAAQRLVGVSPWWLAVLVGATGGWLTAVGGAWKDAPIEGFSPWKFLRSPVVATAWAVVLVPFTESWWVLAAAAGGWSVATIETYKTFLTGGRPPGKFAGKPVRFSPVVQQRWCRLTHAACWGANGMVVALLLPVPLTGWTPESGSLAAVVLVCGCACALVLVTAGPSATVNWSAADPRVGTPPRRSMRHVLLRRTSRRAHLSS